MCSVGGMALHEGGDGGLRMELAMFAPALPAPAALTDEPSRLLGAPGCSG